MTGAKAGPIAETTQDQWGVIGRAARYLLILLVLTFTSPAWAGDAPKVVVTIKPIHALVAAIMEGVGVPTLLVDGSASPHTFTLRPSTARAVNEADIFIRVSPSVEPFTRALASSLPANVTLVTLADAPGVKQLAQRHGGTFEPHVHAGEAPGTDHDDDEDDAGGKDGHIWLDPQNAIAIVAAVRDAFVKRYPEFANRFDVNARRLTVQLTALDDDLKAALAPLRGKPFIIFHDGTQYLEAHYGLNAAGSITVSPDVPPSAKRLTEVRRKIAGLGAICVFTEPNFQPKLVAAVTEGTAARSGELDVEGQALKPGAHLYFELMRGLASSLSTCLSGGT